MVDVSAKSTLFDTRTRWVSRIASAGLIVVIGFLGGFGLWAALHSQHAAQQLAYSQRVSNAYLQTRQAMDDERLFEHEHQIGHGGSYAGARGQQLHRGFDALASRVDVSLSRVRRLGGPADRRLAAQLQALQTDYHHGTDGIFSSVEMGNSGMAMRRAMLADTGYAALKARLDTVTQHRSAVSLNQLGDLQQTDRGIARVTLVAFPIAGLLFVVFLLVLRAYRRRADQATAAYMGQLERDALLDSVTGLRNHRAFEEDLGRQLAAAGRSGAPLSLVLLDLDCLKQVNDTHGHPVGDQRLRALADAMRETVRDSDGCYRIGGDEFALVLVGTRAWGAFRIAQRLQFNLRTKTSGQQTVTAGLAEAGPGMSRDDLIRQADLPLLEAKATQRSVMVYSPELEQDRMDRYLSPAPEELSTIAATLARAVDAKDSLTRSHCETVAETSALIGAELGMDADRIRRLRLAGLLHDVGKIGIPDRILTKPGPLTADEWELMKTHPALGHRILNTTALEQEANWILHHHERVDGKGYPHGLSNDEIPLESRVILVADAFEAMTSDRPYRAGCPEEAALAELRQHAGTQFDPSCVGALAAVLATPRPTNGGPGTIPYEATDEEHVGTAR